MQGTTPNKKMKNDGPDPGQYDNHIKPFGHSPERKMTIGGKY